MFEQSKYFEKTALLESSLKWQEVLDHCALWSASEPDNFLAWASAGLAHRNLGQPESAVEAYKAGIAVATDHPIQYFFAKAISAGTLWNGLGLAYSDLKRVDEAIEAFLEAARIDSEQPKVWDNLGVAYMLKGNAVKALDAFKKAFSLNPADTNSLKNMGLVYATVGQQDGVAFVHQMFLKKSPTAASEFLTQATNLLQNSKNSPK